MQDVKQAEKQEFKNPDRIDAPGERISRFQQFLEKRGYPVQRVNSVQDEDIHWID